MRGAGQERTSQIKCKVDIGEKGLEGNLTRERKECVERTCEGVIVLIQFEAGRRLHMVGCLYRMSRRVRAGGYVYDSTGVNQLSLLGSVPEVGALLPTLTRIRF